jgi:hypothetical protein
MNYKNIISDILYNKCINNSTILIIINNTINILEHFSHIIKYKNLNIHILLNNKSYIELKELIKWEELENKIFLYNDLNDIIEKKIIFNDIIILNIISIISLKLLLMDIVDIVDNNSNIEIYCTLSNEKEEQIIFKNYLRNKISYIYKNMNYVFDFSNYLDMIQKLNEFEILKIDVYQKSNYIIYGNNVIYNTIIKKINKN